MSLSNQQILENNLEEAKKYEDNSDFFKSTFYYKKALEIASKIEGSKNQINLCKNKIVEMNQKAISLGKDFKEISTTQTLTIEQTREIEKFIDSFFKEKNLSIILEKIGKHISLMPNTKDIMESAKKTIPVTYSIVNLSSISNEGHLLKGGNDGMYHWFMKMYDISQQSILILYLNKLVKKLMQEKNPTKKLSLDNLMLYFNNSKLIPKDNLIIIKRGLKSYFEKDYISCMHILVPQFESLFLHISQGFGIDIVALDQKLDIATSTKTLSEHHLNSDEFKNIWKEDFCQQIIFVLFSPMGYKLRHRVAHGEILSEECNFNSCTLILYLFLVLLGRTRIK